MFKRVESKLNNNKSKNKIFKRCTVGPHLRTTHWPVGALRKSAPKGTALKTLHFLPTAPQVHAIEHLRSNTPRKAPRPALSICDLQYSKCPLEKKVLEVSLRNAAILNYFYQCPAASFAELSIEQPWWWNHQGHSRGALPIKQLCIVGHPE